MIIIPPLNCGECSPYNGPLYDGPCYGGYCLEGNYKITDFPCPYTSFPFFTDSFSPCSHDPINTVISLTNDTSVCHNVSVDGTTSYSNVYAQINGGALTLIGSDISGSIAPVSYSGCLNPNDVLNLKACNSNTTDPYAFAVFDGILRWSAVGNC
jgi:hypothetical protein